MEPTWGCSMSGCTRNAPMSLFVRSPVIVVWHCFMIGFKACVEINSKLTSKALPFYLNWNTNVDASAVFCLPSLYAVTQVKRSSCWVCVLLASDTPNNTWYWSILSWDRWLSFWGMHGKIPDWFCHILPRLVAISLFPKHPLSSHCVFDLFCVPACWLWAAWRRAEPDSGQVGRDLWSFSGKWLFSQKD